MLLLVDSGAWNPTSSRVSFIFYIFLPDARPVHGENGDAGVHGSGDKLHDYARARRPVLRAGHLALSSWVAGGIEILSLFTLSNHTHKRARGNTATAVLNCCRSSSMLVKAAPSTVMVREEEGLA